ncbi:hypothetical protein ACROYT_G001613 [Oculina patagonica]
MEFLLIALLLILVHPAAVFADRSQSGACRDNREEFGFALVGHDFRSVHADNFARCFFECSLEEKCQSVTYLWNRKECKMKNETKKSRAEDYVENPAATYMENNFRAKKGSKYLVPGSSCKDILKSGDAQGDGEYWIDPTASGDPFTVFCDMRTDRDEISFSSGGWTLIGRFLMKDANSPQVAAVNSNSYKEILPNYNSNKQYLLRDGFNQLKIDMGFTQIRFYCFKKERGRVLHIMTNKDIKGANVNVVKFFTDSDTMPEACGSFTRLPDDNSTLATSCDKWGYPNDGIWGHKLHKTKTRLFTRPVVITGKQFFRMSVDYDCDDNGESMSLGDTWMIFVR